MPKLFLLYFNVGRVPANKALDVLQEEELVDDHVKAGDDLLGVGNMLPVQVLIELLDKLLDKLGHLDLALVDADFLIGLPGRLALLPCNDDGPPGPAGRYPPAPWYSLPAWGS